MKSSKLNAVLAIVFFAALAVLAFVAQALKPSGAGVDGGAASVGPSGRRALYLLFERGPERRRVARLAAAATMPIPPLMLGMVGTSTESSGSLT